VARKFPHGRKTTRRIGKKTPNFLYIAVCEGSNTEPRYLKDFAIDKGNGLVSIQTIEGAGVPVTIVNEAIRVKAETIGTMSKNGFSQYLEVWAIFDIDDHPNVKQAINKARANGIRVARSNPCFEIWPLLHLESQQAHIDRRVLQKKLERVMPSYKKRKGKMIDYDKIKKYYDLAKDRASSQLREHNRAGAPYSNPSTNIYLLLNNIIKQGKTKS
jgi:RloB-like protein